MIKFAICYLIAFLGFSLFLYVISAFVSGFFNPFDWREDSRLAFVGVSIVASMFIGAFLSEEV